MELSDGGDGGGELAAAAGSYTVRLCVANADDVAKKVVGRSEKELFEALEFSDKVLDEELEVGGWKGNMDNWEVVPTMKGRRPGFDFCKKSEALWRVRDIWEDVSRGTATIGRSCSAERE